MSKFKLGTIGAGAFTEFVLESYQKYLSGLALAAITDPNTEAAQRLAEKFGINTITASNEELLMNPEVNLILVLTPPNTHFEIANQVLNAGKDLLIEKPIAFTVSEAEQLIKLADKKKLKLSANFVLRHHPFHKMISRFVKDKTYGELKEIQTTALLAEYPADHWYWKKEISGGFFLNTFCHFLDLYDYIFGEVAHQSSSTGSADKSYLINSQYSNSREAHLSANLHVTNEQEKVETKYTFDQATITTEGWLPQSLTFSKPDGSTEVKSIDDKNQLYQQLLAQIMAELIERIENPETNSIITNQILLNSVVNSIRSEHN